MRALTYEGPHDIRVAEVPDPAPRDVDSAVIRVTAAGICGSDLHIYDGHGFSPDTGYCVGHEAIGEVVEAGSGVRRFAVGDRVLVPASAGCLTCEPCRRGWVAGCETLLGGCYGLGHSLPGSQAEAVAVPAADLNLQAMPDSMSADAALTLTDNLPTAWYGARRARIEPGDTVAVVGLGPVGMLSVMSAQAMGAGRVLGVDLVAERRAAAAAIGAEPVEGDDPRGALIEMTAGRGAEVVLEAVGADETIRLAIDVAGRAGRVSVVGVNQNMNFPMRMVLAQLKELEFAIGLCSVQRELPTLMRLIEAGRIRPESVVTHHLPLSEGAEAYRLFATREAGVGKVSLDPTR
ncbi:MAG TPA: alcohol dehydrogenase catalytic domain-containing protein [Microthrixaceae bacterium]|nr:alcohol dehydrogenase catalytic domain-containing protein [Microthrixaceae bacterium]